MLITSPANAKIKEVRALRSRKEREKQARFFAEGIRLAVEAATANAHVDLVIVAPALLNDGAGTEAVSVLASNGASILEVSKEVFESIAGKDNPQGIGIVAPIPSVEIENASPNADLCWVALDRPQDPGNVGSILRTCESVGASGVILVDASVDPYDPKSVRASMGAIFTQSVLRTSHSRLITWKKEHDLTLVGVSGNGHQHYREARYRRPLIVLMGSEREGLSPAITDACDETVFLPMVGSADSLNLSVAAGVVLYEIMHRSDLGVL